MLPAMPAKLRRAKALGVYTAVALVVGNMVGAGAYLVPAELGRFGSVGLVGWTVTAAGAVFLALVFGRLGRIYYLSRRHAEGLAPAVEAADV